MGDQSTDVENGSARRFIRQMPGERDWTVMLALAYLRGWGLAAYSVFVAVVLGRFFGWRSF